MVKKKIIKKKIIKKKTGKNKKQIITQSVVINLHKEQKRQQRRGVAPRTSIRGQRQGLDPLSVPLYIQNPTSNNLTGSNFFDELNEFQQRLNERERRLEQQSHILERQREQEANERQENEFRKKASEQVRKIRERVSKLRQAEKVEEKIDPFQERAELRTFANFSMTAEEEDEF